MDQSVCVRRGERRKYVGVCGGVGGFFTGTDSPEGVRVQACLRRAGSRASGTALSYRITQRLPRGLAGVADADKVRESVVFYVDRKTCM